MTTQEQVCTLEQAKRLKELGAKQESYFCWQDFPETRYRKHDLDLWPVHDAKHIMDLGESWSAFTVAELGEMINWDVVALSPPYKEDKKWYCHFDDFDFEDVNEASVRAQALIYLLENNQQGTKINR